MDDGAGCARGVAVGLGIVAVGIAAVVGAVGRVAGWW